MSIVRRVLMGAVFLGLPVLAWAQDDPKPVSISYGSYEILYEEARELEDGQRTLSFIVLKTQKPRMGVIVKGEMELDDLKTHVQAGRLANCIPISEDKRKNAVKNKIQLATALMQMRGSMEMAKQWGGSVDDKTWGEVIVVQVTYTLADQVPNSPWYTCSVQ